MVILGIESSCDETAAAVVRDGTEILSNIVASQQELHKIYGGVVPELACRAHIESITPVIEEAVNRSGVPFEDLDAIAVTHAPGLVGALLIGLSAAKSLAWRYDLPLVAVNHIEAHVYANILDGHPVEFPAVALVVSGGHTAIFDCSSCTEIHLIGSTTDDAAGEAFDKVAAMLGLGYPGGPIIDKTAKNGNPKAVDFPRTYLKKSEFDFSFSGLKTAVLYHVKGQNAKVKTAMPEISDSDLADVVASFQEAVVDVLVKKTFAAAKKVSARCVVIGGGVACNSRLREKFQQRSEQTGMPVYWPQLSLCTDNAAMIAGLAFHQLQAGQVADLSLDVNPTPIRATQSSRP
jgi:N6-L-threonylcarbamoyladenine synthase